MINIKHKLFISLAVLVLTVVFLSINSSPLNGDSLHAWSIAQKIKDSTTYQGGDLVTQAGSETNFLLYKLLANWPILQNNLPLRDTVIYFPILFLYFYIWFIFFYEITANTLISFFALSVFSFADHKLGLHWSYSPVSILVSYSAINFLQIFCFYLFYKRKFILSYILLSLSSFIHPATALSYMATLSLLLLIEREWKKLSISILSFLPLFFLNYYLFIRTGTSFDFTDYHFKIFEMFQMHSFLVDHFPEGYFYCLGVLMLLFNLKQFLPLKFYKFASKLVVCAFVLCSGWLANLYFFKSVQFIYFYYPMRIFYILKPLMILSLIVTLHTYWKERRDTSNSLEQISFYVISFLFAKTIFRFSSLDSFFVTVALIFLIRNLKLLAWVALTLFLISVSFDLKDKIPVNPYQYVTFLLILVWCISRLFILNTRGRV